MTELTAIKVLWACIVVTVGYLAYEWTRPEDGE